MQCHGLRIPEDLSVVEVDGIPMAAQLVVSLHRGTAARRDGSESDRIFTHENREQGSVASPIGELPSDLLGRGARWAGGLANRGEGKGSLS